MSGQRVWIHGQRRQGNDPFGIGHVQKGSGGQSTYHADDRHRHSMVQTDL